MLTERQQRFVDSYRGNGVAAARAAGFRGSDGTLRAHASKLLRHPAVREALAERQARVAGAGAVEPPLTPKHRAFVDAFVEGGNAKAAARAAGYASSTAKHLLERADVREAIELARARRESKEIAQARELQVILTTLARDGGVASRDRIRAIAELHRMQRGVLPAAVEEAAPSEESRRPVLRIVRNSRGPAGVVDG